MQIHNAKRRLATRTFFPKKMISAQLRQRAEPLTLRPGPFGLVLQSTGLAMRAQIRTVA